MMNFESYTGSLETESQLWPLILNLAETAETETAAGKFALLSALNAAAVYRKYLGTPKARAGLSKNLLDPTGGPEHNPHIVLDEIGNLLVEFLAAKCNPSGTLIKLFTEESDEWETINNTSPWTTQLSVAIDALDESSSVAKNFYRQAFGMVIAGAAGRITTGAVASYVDDRLLIYEGKSAKLFSFNPELGTLLSVAAPVREPTPPGKRLSYAMLERKRQIIIANTKFSEDFDYRMPTFGGWAVLELIFNTGSFDFLIDPYGQKVNEACFWGPGAQAAGLAVFDLDGRSIDFDEKFQMIVPGEKERIPMVICYPSDAECLKSYLHELAVNREKILRAEFDD